MKTQNYEVRWSYSEDHKVTNCSLKKKGSVVSTIASAYTNPNDNFCRDTGRKISLSRAIRMAGIPKEQRIEFWDAYRSMKKGGRW